MTRSSFVRVAMAAMLAAPAALISSCDLPTGNAVEQDAGSDYDSSVKLQAYDLSTLGMDLPKLRRNFAGLNLDTPSPSDSPFIEVGRLEGTLRDLERAHGMAGQVPDVDAPAGRFLDALRALVVRAKALDSYFTMRGHIADDYARARRDNAPILAAYDRAIAAYAPFRAATDAARSRADALLLARMRDEGRIADYYDILLAQGARSLKGAVASSAPNAPPRGDRLVANLATMLERARSARAAQEARQPAEERGLDDGALASTELLIGAYRDYRRSGEDGDRERVGDAADGVVMAAQ